MPDYNAREVEKKWQDVWRERKLYKVDLERVSGNRAEKEKPKYYNLTMFPYPSGDRLHIGHWYNYGPVDTWGRYMRMKGFDVFQPMGFDAFGLPAENYAIKTGVHPAETTRKNIDKMKEQIAAIGGMYDLDLNLETAAPEYYRWTQWIFLQLYKKGLAYRKEAPVNWCPGCMTVLANEQVDGGACERCKTVVVQKNLKQWFFKITDYAEKLLDHTGLDWPDRTILMQKHWIGKSEGAQFKFKIAGTDLDFEVFSTRPDTIFGATYCVLSPEHPLVDKVTTGGQRELVKAYQAQVKTKSEMERTELNKDKSGVFTGAFAVNPANGKEIPIWIADYVLMSYGTGAIMAVPGHDERDAEFAKKYELPVICVVEPGDTLVNSDFLDGLTVDEAKKRIIAWFEEKGVGKGTTNYRLRDWLISRQRYWGAPIPIIYCMKCGEVPVPEKDLPVRHPHITDYIPKGTSPLAGSEEFVNTVCPVCGDKAKREVDTMDTFVCSSWYFLRYPDSENAGKAWNKEKVDKWMPVDMYIGGPEHACMHLLYARFLHKVFFDLGLISSPEPFKRLVHQGMITKDGAKMSKSKGNVVSPDDFVEKYGSDVFRMYLMFMGPFTEGGDWNDRGITGVARFVERFYRMIQMPNGADGGVAGSSELGAGMDTLVHQAVAKVTDAIEKMNFNVAIAALMELTNEGLQKGLNPEQKSMIIRVLAPLAPHMAEEAWALTEAERGTSQNGTSVFDSTWPVANPAFFKTETVTFAIQVNGKLRGTVALAPETSKEDALSSARAIGNISKYLSAGEVIKEIFVPGKIIGFVVK
jgi:leucyl-tRNA synthetase